MEKIEKLKTKEGYKGFRLQEKAKDQYIFTKDGHDVGNHRPWKLSDALAHLEKWEAEKISWLDGTG